jgi:hypothetical protein
MRRPQRTVACLASVLLSLVLLAGTASASWLATGSGWGPVASTTASEVTPVVAVLSCSWSSASNTLSVTVTWTKASYGTSDVQRSVNGAVATTIASGLAGGSSSGTYVDTGVPHPTPAKNSSASTASVVYTVANKVGLYWSAAASSVAHTFKLTTVRSGADTCVVV